MKDQKLHQQSAELKQQKKKFTLLEIPTRDNNPQGLQMDMFDPTPVEHINRALDYINELDATVVEKQSAVMVSLIKINDPDHEVLALIAAKAPVIGKYVFKLYSNVEEFSFTPNWGAFPLVAEKIESLAKQLKEFDHTYIYHGDKLLQEAFGLRQKDKTAQSLLFKRNETPMNAKEKRKQPHKRKI